MDSNGKGKITEIEVERSVKKQIEQFEPEEFTIRVKRQVGWDEPPSEAFQEVKKWLEDKIDMERDNLEKRKRDR